MAQGAELTLKIESELKLALTARESDSLREAWGNPLDSLEQRNLYFEDGEDVSLWAREGFAIRLREQDGRWILGVKGEGRAADGWSHRPEWERAVEQADFAGLLLGGALLLAAVVELVGDLPEILCDSDLSLRGELRNTRRRYALPGCEAVVELDHYRLPDGSEGHELELEADDDALRARAEAELREIFGRLGVAWLPSATSKHTRFEMALRKLDD